MSLVNAVGLADETSASLVLLDWFTSGRMARGEQWVFSRYKSTNEVWRVYPSPHLTTITSTCLAKDVLLLEQPSVSASRSARTIPLLQPRSLKDKLAPYNCYATLLLFGPATRALSKSFAASYDAITQMQRREPPDLLWSYSPLADGDGSIVRLAAKETDQAKRWLKTALAALKDEIGSDAYGRAFM